MYKHLLALINLDPLIGPFRTILLGFGAAGRTHLLADVVETHNPPTLREIRLNEGTQRQSNANKVIDNQKRGTDNPKRYGVS